jgi:hypothetical protein
MFVRSEGKELPFFLQAARYGFTLYQRWRATGRSGVLAVKREEAGWMDGSSAGTQRWRRWVGSCGRRIPSQLGESEVVIAQGGLSKYCLHASDVRSLEGAYGARLQAGIVTRDGFQKHRPDWPGGCLQFSRVHQRNGPVLFASTLSGVGEGE